MCNFKHRSEEKNLVWDDGNKTERARKLNWYRQLDKWADWNMRAFSVLKI